MSEFNAGDKVRAIDGEIDWFQRDRVDKTAKVIEDRVDEEGIIRVLWDDTQDEGDYYPSRFELVEMGPRPGDRVRLVIEATVSSDRWLISSGTVAVRHGAEEIVSLEVLPPPAPVWQKGDVVVDPTTGWVALRGSREWASELGNTWTDDEVNGYFLKGQLTHALRAGKPVQ